MKTHTYLRLYRKTFAHTSIVEDNIKVDMVINRMEGCGRD
jgi:hypothetical protein